MKIIVLLLMFATLGSCSKNKYCWKCNVTAIIYSGAQEISRSYDNVDACSMTPSEAKDFEKSNSAKIKNAMSASAKVTTNCYIND